MRRVRPNRLPENGSPRERAIGAIGLIDWVQLGLVTVLAAAVQGALGFAFTLLAVSFFLFMLQSATVGIPGRVWITAAALVPLAWAGAALGHAGARYINEILFRRLVLLLLAATGVYMLIGVLTSSPGL